MTISIQVFTNKAWDATPFTMHRVTDKQFAVCIAQAIATQSDTTVRMTYIEDYELPAVDFRLISHKSGHYFQSKSDTEI